MHSVRENNLRKTRSCPLVFMSKKTNAVRQKSVQIRRAHLTQSKSASKKRKNESVLSVQSVRKNNLREKRSCPLVFMSKKQMPQGKNLCKSVERI